MVFYSIIYFCVALLTTEDTWSNGILLYYFCVALLTTEDTWPNGILLYYFCVALLTTEDTWPNSILLYYFCVALLTTEDTWPKGILLYYLLFCGLADNRSRGHVTKWYFTLWLTSLWPCWQQRTHDQMVFYSITYFIVTLLTTEDMWPNSILLYYLLLCGLEKLLTTEDTWPNGILLYYFCVVLLTTEDTWPNSILLYYLLFCSIVNNRGHVTKWYFTLYLTSLCPCWQQRTCDQMVFYSITYFVVALLTTEDTWSNGILLYYLLLCCLVDNRGHMTKWYFTLILTSLWPCWQQRTCDQIIFNSITYFVVALLTAEDTWPNGILL